jgi:hypothetical protein
MSAIFPSYHYAKTTGSSVLGSVGEELVHPAGGTETSLLDLLDARCLQLSLDGARKVSMDLTIDVTDDLGAHRTGPGDLLCDVGTHFVAARADGWADPGPDVVRTALQAFCHNLNRRLNYASYYPPPAGVRYAHHASDRITQ